MVAIVEGNPNAIFRAGKKQASAHRIFADCVNRRAVRQAAGDQLPGLAAVPGAIYVRLEVICTEAADGSIGAGVVKVRCTDLGDFTPRCQLRWRDVCPVLASVSSVPDESVIGTGPKRIFVLE